MKKTNEEYLNLIELLKQALTFYSIEENYNTESSSKKPIINHDNGSQARFALNKINEFQDDRDEQEKEFVKNMISAIESDANQDTVLGLINEYKKQTDG